MAHDRVGIANRGRSISDSYSLACIDRSWLNRIKGQGSEPQIFELGHRQTYHTFQAESSSTVYLFYNPKFGIGSLTNLVLAIGL